MRIVFMGTPDFAATSLAALYTLPEAEVVGVFTQPDKPVGRKQRLEAPPVKKLALLQGTPVYQPVKLRDGSALAILRELDPALIVVVAYGRILPDEFLAYPAYGAINIHGSLLPAYRGAAPIQWSVINGEKTVGVTSMYMAHDLDAGDIIARKETALDPQETAGELFNRLAPLGATLLCETVRAIAKGTATRTPQDPARVTYAPPLTKELAVIDWTKPARLVIAHINGMNPWPVATATLAGQSFKIYKAVPTQGRGEPGTVLSADSKGIRVATGEESVLITELQAPGGKRMRAADYLRGHPLCL